MSRPTLGSKELPQDGNTGEHLVKQSSNPGDVAWEEALGHSHTNKAILDGDTASYTTEEETKLADIDENANNYSHPVNHPPAIITQDLNNRFVSDSEKSTWNGKQDALGYTAENLAEKGQANGYTPLGGDGKVPIALLPTSPQTYLGTYNIVTNTPTVIDGTGTNGDYFICSVAGTRDFGSGNVAVSEGDSLIYNGLIWEDIPSPASVQSVNEQTGAVVLDTNDIDENVNLYYTESRVNSNTNVNSNTLHRDADGKSHGDVVLNNTHRNGNGSDHTNVALNTTHTGSDGKDHSDVVLNNSHRAGNGSDHTNVALNDTHRTSDGKNHSDVVLNNAHRIATDDPHNVTKTQVDLGNVDNVQQIPLSQKGSANGVATLDSGSKIPAAQLPASVMDYKGAYNIITNTPTLIDGTGDLGDFYKNSVSGTHDFGSGNIKVAPGDALIYSGLIWEKIPSEDLVQSVSGKTGIITLDTDDITEGINKYYTEEKVEAHVFDSVKLTGAPDDVLSWNSDDFTIDIITGLGPVLQVGQELYTIVYNDSGSLIENGKAVYPVTTFMERPSIEKMISDTHETISVSKYVTTMDIPDESFGLATRFGRVRGVDTSSLTEGSPIWVSSTVAGDLTDTKPEFPDYSIMMGGVTKTDAVTGSFFINANGEPEDTVVNFWNGTFREAINFTVSSNGAVITGSLSPENGHPDITMIFSDGFTMFTATPSATIVLTPGTDDIPQENFIYIPKSTKVLTTSTSDWPTAEHIKVASVILRTAATTQTDDALKNHNWNDHIESTTSFQGHLSHITERMRQMQSVYHSGVEGSVTIDEGSTPDDVWVSTTSGKAYQIHKQDFPSFDMQTGDDMHVINHSVTPYLTINNLNSEILDALGATLSNSSFSFVVWGVQNRTGQTSHLMLNLPVGSYSKNIPANAVSDASNFSVYDIPIGFRGVGFLIARFTFVLQPGGTSWSLYDTEDLRGKIPNTTAGGGAGGTGVLTLPGLTDTPSSYTGQKGKVLYVNESETAMEFVSRKTGTLITPPSGLFVGEDWEDITDSADHPIIRTSKVTT
jgi:hypothetical protein